MKTTKRGKLLMLACAALVAVLACLPLLWFRAQDARMFGTVNQSSGLYESREVSGDDFYLLQQVKNRTQMNRTDWMVSAGLDGTAALYTPAGNSRYNMTSSDTAADFAASLLTQLHDAEVLPDTWYHVAADNLSSYSSGELYTSSDSLGITRLLRYPHAAYDESDPEYNESPTFALDYDNKTGRLLNLWVQAPLDDPTLLSGSPVSLNISDLLNAWVQWEGLTDLGDWTVPYGSDYAETGLYSARGNALLTCVYGSFTLDDVPRAYYSMQLTWQPYAPTPQPGSTDLLPAEPLPETSDYYYTDVIAYQWDDDRAAAVFDYDANLILRTNLSTGVQTVFCDVPGCTHTTSSCPARITDQMYSLVPAGDCVYLIYGTYSPTTAKGTSGADINAMSDDEIMRWARAADAGVPLALYTQELEPYTQEDVTAARRWIMTPCISAAAIPPIYTASCGASRAKSPPAGSAWSAPPASTKPCPSRIPTTSAVSGTTSLCCSGSAAPNRSLPIKYPITAWPAVILPGSRTPVMTLCCTTPSPPKAGGYTA